jgi:hypothetical protein
VPQVEDHCSKTFNSSGDNCKVSRLEEQFCRSKLLIVGINRLVQYINLFNLDFS